MNKSELVSCAANVTGARASATKALDALLMLITETLRAGEAAVIPGLGKFTITARPERQGRHPGTGSEITIPARNAVKFTPEPALKSEMDDYTL